MTYVDISGPGITTLTGDVIATTSLAPVATIQPNVVDNSKLAQMPANTIKGNNTGSTSNASDLTVSQVNTLLGTELSANKNVANGYTGLDSNGLVLFSEIPSTPASKTFYVDKNRVDSYTPDGSRQRPFLTIQAAVNKVAANNDGSLTAIYNIDIIGAGTYVENVTLNDLGLKAISFEGHGNVTITPASGDAMNSTSNNNNLVYMEFLNLIFGRTVRLNNATSGSNFGLNGVFIRGCLLNAASEIKAVVGFDIFNSRTNTLSLYNVRSLTYVNCSFAGTVASISALDVSNPTPFGWVGTVTNSFRTCLFQTGWNDTSLSSPTPPNVSTTFSNCAIVNSSPVVVNGTANFLGTLVGAPVTISAGGTATQTASLFSNTITNNGTLTNNNNIKNADINAAAAIAYSKLNLSNGIVNADVNSSAAIALTKLGPYTPANAANWANPQPTTIQDAIDRMAAVVGITIPIP